MNMKRIFETVVTEHQDMVLRVCRGVLGAHADAEDAWSETFMAALRAWPTLPEDTNIEAWLVTIAHRKAIDITRSRARRAITVEHLPETASTRGIPGEEHELWAAVRALPERQRLALSYHYFGGLPYSEVAALIGGSAEAARRAGSAGVATLRTHHHTKGPLR